MIIYGYRALSKFLKAEVYRDGTIYSMDFVRGFPQSELKNIGSTDKRGTKITFLPDDQVFEVSEYSFDILSTLFNPFI